MKKSKLTQDKRLLLSSERIRDLQTVSMEALGAVAGGLAGGCLYSKSKR